MRDATEMRLFFAFSCATLGALDMLLAAVIRVPVVQIICVAGGLYCLGAACVHLYRAIRP